MSRTVDVDSLFTETFLKIQRKVEGLSKIKFKELLSLATKESYFIFNGKLYKQVYGFVMVLPLCPTIANGFFLYTLKRIGYKIIHLTLSAITTDGMLMISLF